MRFVINNRSDVPYYKQIVDEVCRSIKDGTLKNGDRMPTVRELADELKIARGTIKHAYSELARLGLLNMTQGRGTFVRYEEQRDTQSKKERAMREIDALLDDMEGMSFTLREIQIFFDLKLRERSGDADTLEAAVVGESMEDISAICAVLSRFSGISVKRMLLEDVLCSPDRIDAAADIIITEAQNKSKLSRAVLDYSRVVGIYFEVTGKTVADIARIDADASVAIIAFSQHTLDVIQEAYKSVTGSAADADVAMFTNTNSIKRALDTSNVIIVPDCFSELGTARMKNALAAYVKNGGIIIDFSRIPDGGSTLMLDERIKSIQDSLKNAIPY